MCYYIQKVHKYEVLEMKVEFFLDMNGLLWFYYAKDIRWRDCGKRDIASGQEAKK
jgi:hypothetical protein